MKYSILLDAHALSEYANDTNIFRPWLKMARGSGSEFFASTATLAEVTDGTSRDANIRRVARNVDLVPVSKEIGYDAGRLRARAANLRRKPRDLTVDAIVAATALDIPPPVIVLTSDKPDLELMLADYQGIQVHDIG